MARRKFFNINTPKELSLQLGLDLQFLQDVAKHIKDYYFPTEEPDNKGKIRKLCKPKYKLKIIHRRINQEVLEKFAYPETIQGGIVSRSILTNAKPHVGKKIIARYDIKDFFPSVDYHVVYQMFRNQRCAPDVAKLLTELTTVNAELPQGFGTSPKISGLVLLNLDYRLSQLFKKYGLKYSFWIDDLTVSGNYPVQKLTALIGKIFRQEGFKIKDEKTDYAGKFEQQKVTGVVINAKPNVAKQWREKLRQELYLCNKFGVQAYLDAHSIEIDSGSYLNSLNGRVAFYLSIRPDKQNLLQQLKEIQIKNKP